MPIRRYHENDADTGRYRTGDIDEWDQKYFGVNQEMVFELILVRFALAPTHLLPYAVYFSFCCVAEFSIAGRQLS
jgi:hypothetical protein